MSKILIVENTALTALRLKIELEQAGYVITDTCATADEAINSIIQILPDIVLLDFHLDKASNGATVAQFLNTNYSNIPIIYLSEYSDDETVDVIDKTQFYAYLTKPFKRNALLLTIKQALQQKQQQDALLLEKVTFTYEHIEHRLLASEILWINTKPSTKGIFISTKQAEEQYRIYESLKDFLKTRQLTNFVQISSSYILNLDYVTDIISDGRLIIPTDNLPITRDFILDTPQGRIFKVGKTFKKRMSDWLKVWSVK